MDKDKTYSLNEAGRKILQDEGVIPADDDISIDPKPAHVVGYKFVARGGDIEVTGPPLPRFVVQPDVNTDGLPGMICTDEVFTLNRTAAMQVWETLGEQLGLSVTRKFELVDVLPCSVCTGTGMRPTRDGFCALCMGSGQEPPDPTGRNKGPYKVLSRRVDVVITEELECPTCEGKGTILTPNRFHTCLDCRGSGRANR